MEPKKRSNFLTESPGQQQPHKLRVAQHHALPSPTPSDDEGKIKKLHRKIFAADQELEKSQKFIEGLIGQKLVQTIRAQAGTAGTEIKIIEELTDSREESTEINEGDKSHEIQKQDAVGIQDEPDDSLNGVDSSGDPLGDATTAVKILDNAQHFDIDFDKSKVDTDEFPSETDHLDNQMMVKVKNDWKLNSEIQN